MPDSDPLLSLLRQCTVRVDAPNGHGTGFFVAPGLILTCAHVIQSANGQASSLQVYHNDSQEIQDVQRLVAVFPAPYPDVALLQIDRSDHPCVYLNGAIKVGAKLYVYGYSQRHSRGDSITLDYEGPMMLDEKPALKLKAGLVEPGFSGSPVLNLDTGAVCGVLKLTRDEAFDLGGGAIPLETIFQYLPELQQLNADFQRRDMRWAQAREQAILPVAITQAVSAALWLSEADIVNKPPILIGRDNLLAEIYWKLVETRRVLLTGMGGIGKTTLAVCTALRYLEANEGPVIWLQANTGQAEALIEALASCLGHKAEVVSQTGIAQATTLRQFLTQTHVGLLVIDDAQVGTALHEVLQVMPDSLPVLMTSRQRLGALRATEVGDLAPNDSLKLLGYYAGQQDFSGDQEAARLCDLVGDHPYALELAGATLADNSQTPAELRRMIAGAPYLLSAPGEYAPRGHESIKALLDQSVNTLEATTCEVFTAFGAFFAPGITPDLLAAYLGRTPDEVQKPLGELVRRSLAKRQLPTDYYYLHDLTFSYAQGRFREERREPWQAVTTVKNYVTAHAQDYDQIGVNLANILGAADIADQEALVQIMSMITIGGYPRPQIDSYFRKRGHSLAFLDRLDKAIEAAKQMQPSTNATLHYLLGRRGDAYFDRRDFDHAIETYQLALNLSPNNNRRVILLVVIGQAFAEKQDDSKADNYLEQAYNLAESSRDDHALSFVLEHRSLRAGRKRDYLAARQLAAEATEINRRIGDTTRLGYSLLNLGSAELDLGNASTALEVHQEAVALAQNDGNFQLAAEILHALAEDYHKLNLRQEAQTHFKEALELCRQTGDVEHEARIVAFMSDNGYSV